MAFPPPRHLGLPLRRKAPTPLAPSGPPWDLAGGVIGGGLGGGEGRVVSRLASLLPLGEPPEPFPTADEGEATEEASPSADLGDKRPAGDFGSSAAESKRLKRLEKNRESARECRRRKKEHKEKLEAELAALEEENLNLRLQLKVGDEAEDAENSEIKEIKARLDDMVSKGAPEGEILQTMDLLKERYADYGSVHTSAADFHLDQLSRLLLPTLTTRACMHAVLQSASPSIACSTASEGGGKNAAVAPTGGESKQQISIGLSAQSAGVGAGSAVVDNAGTADPGGVSVPSSEQSQFPTDEALRGQGKKGLNSAVAMEDGRCGDSAAVGSPDPVSGNRLLEGNIAGVGQRAAEAAAGALGEAKSGVAVASNGVTSAPDQAGMRDNGAESEGAALVDMWSSLVEVLEATEEQQNAMRGQVGAIAELARDLEGTTEILRRLKLLLEDRSQTLDGEMAEIQRILTPTQTAKFVLWVSKNSACVHMLNQLWDKLHGDPTRDDK